MAFLLPVITLVSTHFALRARAETLVWGVFLDVPLPAACLQKKIAIKARYLFSFPVPFLAQEHLQGLAAKEEDKRAAFLAQMGLKAGQKITIQPRRDG